jgi:hypothetical protein
VPCCENEVEKQRSRCCLSYLENALQRAFWKMFFSEKKSSRVVCPVCVDLRSAIYFAYASRSFCHVSFSPFLFASFSFFLFLSFTFLCRQRLLLLSLCCGQVLPNKCELCNGTFNCRAAEPIGYGSTPCEVRQFAFAFQAHGCQGGLFQETSLQVYDESVRLNPDVATFNVHIFRSADDRIDHKPSFK